MEKMLVDLLTRWREATGPMLEDAGILEVFLAALGTKGTEGFQCELSFGHAATKSFQATSLELAVSEAHTWAIHHYKDRG